MHAKPSIIGWVLMLIMAISGVTHAVYAATDSPPSAGHEHTAQWKSTPEDSASWRREPFKKSDSSKQKPGGTSAKQLPSGTSPEIALSGIMKVDKHYYAIVNGRTVKARDQIDGWTITEISRHRLTISHEKEKKIYDIYQGRIDRGTK